MSILFIGMLITGIYNISQIRNKHATEGFWGGRKRLSIALYDQILNEHNSEELAERILLPFTDDRGAYKRTYSKRFEQFDASVLQFLKEHLSEKDLLVVQDVGISDGRTACDFYEKLVTYFQKLSYFASDYDSVVLVIEDCSASIALSRKGRLLECVWPPFVFNVVKKDSRIYFPLNHLIQFFVQRLIARKIEKKFKQGELSGRELFLFSPKTLKLANIDSRFHLGQHDLLMPFEQPSHIIRAMNVLNLNYFKENEWYRVINNIHSGLLNRGFLITGSNQDRDSKVHGGIYQKNLIGFEQVWQSNNGSPIDEKISVFKTT